LDLNRVFKDPQDIRKPHYRVKTETETSRRSIGRPLILKLPSESVIPVTLPNDITNPIGFFVLLDNNGYPITKNTSNFNEGNLNDLLQNNTNLSSLLIEKTRQSVGSTCKKIDFNQAVSLYTQIMETDLINRLKNGIYKTNMNVAMNQEVLRIMLARTLKNMQTQLLFIPSELVSYFAIKYHSNGVGKSLLDNLKILTSLRAVLLFSRIMGEIKSSIALTL